MKNLLIISSTKNSNFQLSQEIKSFFDKKENISSSVISLEELDLPLFMPSLEENFKKKDLKIIKVSKVLLQKFRKKYLYEGLSDNFSKYKEDNLRTTIHLALLIEDEVISGLTLIKTKFNNNDAFQIRGMFTITDFCYKGYGSQLVKHVKSKFLINEIKYLWCNSRFEAINFYKKNNFKETGNFFTKNKIGKHKKLYFKL